MDRIAEQPFASGLGTLFVVVMLPALRPPRDDGTNVHGAVTGDHAGHIAAHRFMLDQGLKNLFPQNVNFNTSAYKMMENEWAALVRDGLQVEGTVAFDFSADTRRPDVVKVEFEGLDDGGAVVFEPTEDPYFINESGQPYDRTYR